MYLIFHPILLVLILTIFTSLQCSPVEKETSEDSFRGVVLYPSDIQSLGAKKLVTILKDGNINLLGIHSNSITEDLDSLKTYLQSKDGRLLIDLCEEYNIDVEYECHVLQEILPRSLFSEKTDYFRMNEDGNRTADLNMCFSSEEAWDIVEENIFGIAQWIKPTTNRYYFWIDDSYDGFCHCNECSIYSPSDQALIFENRVLEVLRKVNSKAKLAHLAYASTLNAPKLVKPLEGIFLEFAPIGRDYEYPLPSDQLEALKENLKIFPAESAHILEYWLDVSMFSGWDRDTWTEVVWDYSFCKRDVVQYRNLGINSYTTFATWMLHQRYFDLYGENESIAILNEYSSILSEK